MQFDSYDIEGLISFIPRKFEDDRGSFFESFNKQRFEEMIGSPVNFVQDNESTSKRNVVRGLHFQIPPFGQGKLVRVSRGRAIDIAVDIRKDSPTFGKHISVELSSENGVIFWIPEGFAHGFVALEENTVFNYKCTNYYNAESERSLLWNDTDLQIDWGVESPILSQKDSEAPNFADFNSPF